MELGDGDVVSAAVLIVGLGLGLVVVVVDGAVGATVVGTLVVLAVAGTPAEAAVNIGQ